MSAATTALRDVDSITAFVSTTSSQHASTWNVEQARNHPDHPGHQIQLGFARHAAPRLMVASMRPDAPRNLGIRMTSFVL